MATIISASINLSKIDKTKIIKGEKGQYYNIDVIVNDEPDKYGKNVSVSDTQTKEQRQAKEKKTYIGNGKVIWTSQPNVPPPSQSETPFTDEMNRVNQGGDASGLPF
jgi:hypothetical protein